MRLRRRVRGDRTDRRHRPRGDSGTTLAELLVVMGLMGLIGTLVMSVSVQTAKVLTRSADRGGDTQQVRVALEAVTRTLRGAVDPDTVPKVTYAAAGTTCNPAGTTGTGNTATDATRCAFIDATSGVPELRSGPRQVAFWSSVYDLSGSTATLDGNPSAPVLYRYALTPAGEVTEQVWTGAYASGSTLLAPTRSRVLARGIDTSATAPPLFTYLAVTDTTIPSSGPTPSSLTTASDPLLSPSDVGRLATVEVWLTAVRERGGRAVSAVDSVVLPNDPEVTSL